jgi:type IV secretion system protein VirB3
VTEEDPLETDTLFLALTRPAMWLGVPIEALMIVVFIAVFMLLATSNPLYSLLFAGTAYALIRLIVRTDYNMFRILSLWTQTKTKAKNRDYWQGSTYSPLPVKGLKRKGFVGVSK